jgi:hypothetical protein
MSRSRPSPQDMCEPGDGFGGRESISKDPHTKSFLGIRPAALEGRCAAGRVNQGRWVYEGEEKERGAARWEALEIVQPAPAS